MRRISLRLLLLCIAVFAVQIAIAQEKKDKKEKKEYHVMIKVVEDGKETVIDTVFHEFKGHEEIIELMKLKDMPDSLMKKHMVWFSHGDKHRDKCKKIIKSFTFDSDSAHSFIFGDKAHMMKKFKFSGGGGHFFVHPDDSIAKKEIRIEMLHGGDRKFHMIPSHGMRGEQVIIINDSDDIEISEEDGYKIIKIKISDKVSIEEDIDKDVKVEVKVEEKDGKKIRRKKKSEK